MLCRWLFICGCIFLSTPSARRATAPVVEKPVDKVISIHALREEGDVFRVQAGRARGHFYPRPPRGGRQSTLNAIKDAKKFLSTPSARRATVHLVFRVQAADISIHALREEGDARPIPPLVCVTVFLSTPSARRATQWMFAQSSVMVISIHALREEGDIPFSSASSDSFLFLSTPSARRATRTSMGTTAGWRISIHALREEGDYMRMMQLLSNAVFLSTPSARRATSKLFHSLTRHDDFYPRPPRGGRPAGRTYGQQVLFISIHALREEGDLRKTVDRPEPSGFLSTPSARRATLTRETRRVPWEISIHALREEGDRCCQKYCPGCRYFYPRPPRGGRLLRGELEPIGFLFLSTPSARRATVMRAVMLSVQPISIHALREEGDTQLFTRG